MIFLSYPGSERRVGSLEQQLPADVERGLERPPDQHGHDPRHPHVHGPGLRAAEQL